MSFFARGGNNSDSDDSSDDDEVSLSSGDEGDDAPKANGGINGTAAATGKKSKFSANQFLADGGSDDSDSEDSDDSDEDDSDEDSDEDGGAKKKGPRAGMFLKGAASEGDSDSDEDGERKVVKSAKDKRLEEMEATVKVMENAIKINDWVAISNEFDKLLRLITRHQSLTITLPPAAQTPPLYVKTLLSLDDLVTTTSSKEKDAKKKMNAAAAKGLNGMRQKVKKQLREFENQLESYKSDLDAFEAAYLDATSVVTVVADSNAVKAERKAAQQAAFAAGEGQQADDFMTVGKGGRALNLTSEGVFKTLKTISESRGRKNTDRADTIKILSKLLEVSTTSYQKIRVLLTLVPARLDYSQNLASMPHDSWCSALTEMKELLTMLLGPDKDYQVVEDVEEYDDMVERKAGQGIERDSQRVKVRGSLISILENLDTEFTKTLQHTDQHGSEYVERLREEKPLYETIVKAQVLFEREGWTEPCSRAVMRRLEHVYSKPDVVINAIEAAACATLEGETSGISNISEPPSGKALVHALSIYIYSSAPALIRTRSMLCHIYNIALRGNYFEARDMLLMSHLQDSISHADVPTQILYNRVVVQLGLAAFKKGHTAECQSTLLEVFSSQRAKELLAQGTQRFSQNTPEQDLIEKRRLLPFHMHINLELLETAFLVSSMLHEIPLLASLDTDEQKRRAVSKPFRRLLDQADRQAFMGPPENTRDHIMQASKALQAGEWEKARDLILSIKIWGLLDDAAAIKQQLAKKIQEQALRTYLFTFSAYYDSLSLSLLSSTFALTQRQVIAIVSKMIWTDELAASLDQIDGVVVFHRVEQSRIQQLAQELASKAEALVEMNEKTLDIKLGGTGQGDGRDGGNKNERGGDGRGRTGGNGRGRGGAYRGRGGGRGGFNSGLGSNKAS